MILNNARDSRDVASHSLLQHQEAFSAELVLSANVSFSEYKRPLCFFTDLVPHL